MASNNTLSQQSLPQIEIGKFISVEVYSAMVEAADLAYKNKQSYVGLANWWLALINKFPNLRQLVTNEDLRFISNNSQANTDLKNINEGKVFFDPSIRETLLTSFLKRKGAAEVGLLEVLNACFLMPEINKVVRTNPNLAKVFEVVKQEVEGTQVSFEEVVGMTKLVSFEETYWQEFVPYCEEIVRSLANKNIDTLVVHSKTGLSVEPILFAALETAKQKMVDFRYFRLIGVDGKALANKVVSEDKIFLDLIENFRINSPAIILLNNIDTLGQDGLKLAEGLREVCVKAGVSLVVGVSEENYFAAMKNLVGEKISTLGLGEISDDSAKKLIHYKLEKVKTDSKIGYESALVERIFEVCKRHIPKEAFPGKSDRLIDELVSEARVTGVNSITDSLLTKIMSIKTGLPLGQISQSEREVLMNLEKILREKVIGQEDAVSMVAAAIKRSRSGLKDPKKPIGSFLFLGPTGVGKTELAKQLQQIYFVDEKAFLRFDMSEYSEPHNVMRLIGSPPGYVGYEEGGQLTNFVANKPYCLILFDEIEKAHPKVFDIFLQLLDEGRLTDGKGVTVDFRNTIMIFTSNIAAEEIARVLEENKIANKKEIYEKIALPALTKVFRMELLNRFDGVAIFNPLSLEVFLAIAKIKLGSIQKMLASKRIGFEMSEDEILKLVKENSQTKFGARSIHRAINELIENPISEIIISGKVAAGQIIYFKDLKIMVKNANT